MSPTTLAVIGVVVTLLLMFIRVPVGFAMGIVGVVGFGLLVSPESALNMAAREAFENAQSYSLSVVPLFVLMGTFAFVGGLSEELFKVMHKWIGHMPGGLAMASIGGCAAFSAICGSTVATAVTMGKVAIPEMRNCKYDAGISAGTIAAAGTLGILIPPSVVFVIIGTLTELSIGKLFAAGIVPGLLCAGLMILAVYLRVVMNPSLAPPGPKASFKERIRSLPPLLYVLLIFIMFMGGLFAGYFSPTEAAGFGAFAMLILVLARKRLNWQRFNNALADTAIVTGMLFIMIIGAMIFSRFVAITKFPFVISEVLARSPLPPIAILWAILIVYLIGGCFVDIVAFIMLTVPVLYPLVTSLGFDGLWFGVLLVLVTMAGAVTPPVGLSVFAIAGVFKDIPIFSIFRGAVPSLLGMLVCIVLVVAFPQIATWLPSFMTY